MNKVKKIILWLVFMMAGMLFLSDSVYAADDFTCQYVGQVSGGTLKIEKKEIDVNNLNPYLNMEQSLSLGWEVTYPGSSEPKFFSSIITLGNVFPSNNCEDVFYSKENEKFFAVDRNSFYYIQTINQYCSTYSDLEQFCADGTCKIEDAACGGRTVDTEWGTCPAEILPVVKFLKMVAFNTLQIFVPIILIIMGTIDLTKAVIASDDKAIKDATSKFIKRAITAILVFFITTIVTIVMNALAKADIEGFEDWKACWFYDQGEVDTDE